MTIQLNNIQDVERYLYGYLSHNIYNIQMFHDDEHKNRHIGIYKMPHGYELMQYVFDIKSNVQEMLYSPKLVPVIHETPDLLIGYIHGLLAFIEKREELLKKADPDSKTWTVNTFRRILDSLLAVLRYIVDNYQPDIGGNNYLQMMKSLHMGDVNGFIITVKSILSSVPYTIRKEKEGYYHSNIHVLLRTVGFEITSEDTTNLGRIDSVIRTKNIIYVIEFKLNSAEEAIDQIKTNKYYEKYLSENKIIKLVGISINAKENNIGDFLTEEIAKG